MMMVALLTRAGCDVQSAWNLEKALRLAERHDFDLTTLDIDLPQAGGFKICRRLREFPHLQNTPVVFMSGCATLENQQRAFALGAVDFIEKPFAARDFVSRILSHLTESTPA
jgi:DNA-binding response OmpR family regulator